jgi:hypothetical protein
MICALVGKTGKHGEIAKLSVKYHMYVQIPAWVNVVSALASSRMSEGTCPRGRCERSKNFPDDGLRRDRSAITEQFNRQRVAVAERFKRQPGTGIATDRVIVFHPGNIGARFWR